MKAGFNVGPVSQSPTRLKMQADCVECRHKTRLTGAWASSSRRLFFRGGDAPNFTGTGDDFQLWPIQWPMLQFQWNWDTWRASTCRFVGEIKRANATPCSFKKKGVLKTSISTIRFSLCSTILLRVLLKWALLGSHVRLSGVFLSFSANRRTARAAKASDRRALLSDAAFLFF